MINSCIRIRYILCLVSMLIGLNAYAQTDSDHSKKFNAAQTPYQFQWDMDVVSDYRSRGLTQTFGMPAVQGGVGLMLPNHFYVGNWNSTVSSGAGYPGALLETDLFGGWAQQIDEYHINTGIYGIIYPGSNVSNYVFSPFKTGMSPILIVCNLDCEKQSRTTRIHRWPRPDATTVSVLVNAVWLSANGCSAAVTIGVGLCIC